MDGGVYPLRWPRHWSSAPLACAWEEGFRPPYAARMLSTVLSVHNVAMGAMFSSVWGRAGQGPQDGKAPQLATTRYFHHLNYEACPKFTIFSDGWSPLQNFPDRRAKSNPLKRVRDRTRLRTCRRLVLSVPASGRLPWMFHPRGVCGLVADERRWVSAGRVGRRCKPPDRSPRGYHPNHRPPGLCRLPDIGRAHWAPQACFGAWREPPDEALVLLHDVHTFATAPSCQSVSHSLRRPWAVARRCVIAGATAAPAGGCARSVPVVSGVLRPLGLRIVGVCAGGRVSEACVVRRVPGAFGVFHAPSCPGPRRSISVIVMLLRLVHVFAPPSPGASARAACGPSRHDWRRRLLCAASWRYDSYLVDPASSHMLVSKIKPCMSKYKLLYTVKLRMAH